MNEPRHARSDGTRAAGAPSRRRTSLVVLPALALWLASLMLGGHASAQAIGDALDAFLDATGATPASEEGAYLLDGAVVRPTHADGVLVRVDLAVDLDSEGIAVAARTLALASGYGAGIEAPLTSFLSTRAQELAGEGPVTVRLEEYLLEVDVRGEPPYEAEVALEHDRVATEAFGAPAAWIGPEDADVVVREFSDFQCPFCARFAHEVLPALEASLADDGAVRFEFHHFPLESIHANARPAAEAAQCVADAYGNDAFWAFHDLLFERQGAWQGLADPHPYFVRSASELPPEVLDDARTTDRGEVRERIGTCLSEGEAAEVVGEALQVARDLRLSGTPSVFVGGYRVQDFGDPAAYARRIRLTRAVDGD